MGRRFGVNRHTIDTASRASTEEKSSAQLHSGRQSIGRGRGRCTCEHTASLVLQYLLRLEEKKYTDGERERETLGYFVTLYIVLLSHRTFYIPLSWVIKWVRLFPSSFSSLLSSLLFSPLYSRQPGLNSTCLFSPRE